MSAWRAKEAQDLCEGCHALLFSFPAQDRIDLAESGPRTAFATAPSLLSHLLFSFLHNSHFIITAGI